MKFIKDAKLTNMWIKGYNKAVDAASLAVFRICFGVLTIIHMGKIFATDHYYKTYIMPELNMPHYLMTFLPRIEGPWMYVPGILVLISALGLTLGKWYRLSCIVLTISYNYLFYIEHTEFQNHYYLIGLLALLFLLTDAHHAFSLDYKHLPEEKKDKIPAWNLWIFRGQFLIVYLFGGIVKLDKGWLSAYPIRSDLAEVRHPILSPILHQPLIAKCLAYGGALFDISIGFLLLTKRFFKLAVWLCLGFHAFNHYILYSGLSNSSIGIFPFLGVAAIGLFTAPEYPKKRMKKWAESIENITKTLHQEKHANYGRIMAKLSAGLLIIGFSLVLVWPFFNPSPLPEMRVSKIGRFSYGANRVISDIRLLEKSTKGPTKQLNLDLWLPSESLSKTGGDPELVYRIIQQIKHDIAIQSRPSNSLWLLWRVSVNGNGFKIVTPPKGINVTHISEKEFIKVLRKMKEKRTRKGKKAGV